MRYLTVTQLLIIHSVVIDMHGGLHGIKNRDALNGIAQTPRQSFDGKELYPTVFEKAAAYIREIIGQHVFLDGNKRTGMAAGEVFLERNGYALAVKKGAIEAFALKVANERLDIKKIAAWLKKYSKKI